MNVKFVDLQAQYQSIKGEIDAAMAAVVAETAFVGGKYAKAFEESFAAYCGVGHAVGVGNGTDAIYVALRALGVGPGHEVITVANSFVATSEAITMTGAAPVFVDCDPETRNIDPDLVRAAITDRTRAIVPVHLFGRPADVPAFMDMARERGIVVVEDAAQAHGAEFHGRRAGTMGHAACFSFYPGKNLGAYGDAGAVVTDDEDLARRVRMIANHGRMSKYDHEFEGVNSRMDGMQGAILSAKLPHLEDWTARRRAVAAQYREQLAGTPDLVLPADGEGLRHVYHLFVVRVPERDAVQAFLRERGVATGVHYPIPLPLLKAYARLGFTAADFPVASALAGDILSLPMFPELTPEQVEYVSDNLKAALVACRPGKEAS